MSTASPLSQELIDRILSGPIEHLRAHGFRQQSSPEEERLEREYEAAVDRAEAARAAIWSALQTVPAGTERAILTAEPEHPLTRAVVNWIARLRRAEQARLRMNRVARPQLAS